MDFRDDDGKHVGWKADEPGDCVFWPAPICAIPKKSTSAYGTDF